MDNHVTERENDMPPADSQLELLDSLRTRIKVRQNKTKSYPKMKFGKVCLRSTFFFDDGGIFSIGQRFLVLCGFF